MLSVLLQFIPLALAAIAPTMVIFVTAILPTEHGFARAIGTIAGRYAAHLLLGFLFIFMFSYLPDPDPDRTIPDYLSLLMLLAGVALLLMAAWVLLREEDPDKAPSASPALACASALAFCSSMDFSLASA